MRRMGLEHLLTTPLVTTSLVPTQRVLQMLVMKKATIMKNLLNPAQVELIAARKLAMVKNRKILPLVVNLMILILV